MVIANFLYSVVIAFALFACTAGCSQTNSAHKEYSFLSYNACNLFDDIHDGTEYAQFDPARGKWTTADYTRKLGAVGKVITAAVPGGPDFVALVEIENGKVLRDLAAGPLRDAGYNWGASLPTEGVAVSVGFLSRLPVRELRGHLPPAEGFHQRAFFELSLDVSGEPLTVFICHFKAKTEGEAATEKTRRLAAHTLARRVAALAASSPQAQILILGDLNENADEYKRKAAAYITALMPASAAASRPRTETLAPLYVTGKKNEASFAKDLVFYSPWLDQPPHEGSYYYKSWETIDHALLAPGLVDDTGLVFLSFEVVRQDFMLNEAGAPKKEYSDHLPILVRLQKK